MEGKKTPTKPRGRSPAYPSMSLGDAIEKARILYNEANRHEIHLDAAIVKMGYSKRTGPSLRAVAALSQYGLITESGTKDDRKIRLSDRALQIFELPSSDNRRATAVESAAISPKIFKLLREKYGVHLPADDVIKGFLTYDKEFQSAAADSVIKTYKETIKYSKLDAKTGISDNLDNEVDNSDDIDEEEATEITIGTHVQWTSQGAYQFSTPRKVIDVSNDGNWVFVEGTATGLPMSELSVMEPSTVQAAQSAAARPPANPYFNKESEATIDGCAKEQITLDEGPVIISRPSSLSADSVEDLEYWLQGLMRRWKRKAGTDTPE